MKRKFLSWLFLAGALAVGVQTVCHFEFDQGAVFAYFILPFLLLAMAMQYAFAEQANHFERGEVYTDALHNVAIVLVNAMQGAVLGFIATRTHPLLNVGWLHPDTWPLWCQTLAYVLIMDFFYFATHAMAHRFDFLWRFHSVHHSPHRISVLNGSRAHPVDILWRRLLPSAVVLQFGIGAHAMILGGVIAAVLAMITHMNVKFRFGRLNYVLGTNEVHRWHHSTVVDEAKNFGMIMLWDHLFGTFYLPTERKRPQQMGLFKEGQYPVHGFFRQMLIPFQWTKLNGVDQAGMPAGEAKAEGKEPEAA